MPLDSSNPFSDLVPQKSPAEQSDNPFADLIPKPTSEKPPSPGLIGSVVEAGRTAVEAGRQGIAESLTAAGQYPTAFQDRPQPQAETSPVGKLLAQPITEGWKDPQWWIAHIAHGAAGSAPSLALGAAGTFAGSVAGPVGAVAGGAGGFALGSAIQEMAPAYQKARQEGLSHDDAVNRAVMETGIATAFGGIMGAAPAATSFLKRPISEALLQIFGTQPALGVAQQAATGAVEGKPLTAAEAATTYAENVGVGAALAGGHAAARRALGRPEAEGPTPETPPVSAVPTIGETVGIAGPDGSPRAMRIVDLPAGGVAVQDLTDGLTRTLPADEFLARRTELPAPPVAVPARGETSAVAPTEAPAAPSVPVQAPTEPPQQPDATAQSERDKLTAVAAGAPTETPEAILDKRAEEVQAEAEKPVVPPPTAPPVREEAPAALPALPAEEAAPAPLSASPAIMADATSGLVNLGFKQKDAARAVAEAAKQLDQSATIEDLIRKALPIASPTRAPREEAPTTTPQSYVRPAEESSQLRINPIRTDEAFTPTGRKIPVEYGISDVHDLITSHDDDLRENPSYPQELQPRDRARVATADQMTDLLSPDKFRPELLGEGPEAGSGAPIIGPEGFVDSGNLRTMALRRAYDQGLPAAEAYRNYLKSKGYPVEGIASPVLVRVNRSGASLPERADFNVAANIPPQAAMSATEQAAADANRIPGGILSLAAGADLTSAANRKFVKALLENVTTAGERGALMDAQGNISAAGEKRLQAALLSKAYGDPVLISSLLEDPEPNIKSIGAALQDAAAAWAKLRAAISEGRAPPDLDITPKIVEAAKLVSQARGERQYVVDFINQRDMFGGVDPTTESILRQWMFSGEKLTRQVGRDKIADALMAYADGAGRQRLNAQERIAYAGQQARGAAGDLLSLEGLEEPKGATPLGPRLGEGRTEAQGSEPREGRMEPPAPGEGGQGLKEEASPRGWERAEPGDFKYESRDTLTDAQRMRDQGSYSNDLAGGNAAARDYVFMEGTNTGREYFGAVDHEGNIVDAGTSGLVDAIKFSDDTLRRLWSQDASAFAYHHNHPSDYALSAPDLMVLAAPNMASITAHGHEGAISSASLSPEARNYLSRLTPSEQQNQIKLWAGLMDELAAKGIDPLVQRRMLSRQRGNMLLSEARNRLLAATGIIDYISTRAVPPWLNAHLSKVADDLGSIAGEVRDRIDRSPGALRPEEAMARISDAHAEFAAERSTGEGGDRGGAEGAEAASSEGLRSGAPPEPPPTGAEPEDPSWRQRSWVAVRAAFQPLVRDVQMKVAPMAVGTEPAQAITKDFANAERAARYRRQTLDDAMKRYSPEQRRQIWEAADAISVTAQMAGPEATWRSLWTLPRDQMEMVLRLDGLSRDLWARAKDAGVVSGDPLPFYTTRAVLNIGEDGVASRVGQGDTGARGLEQIGINLRTKGVDARRHLTVEETEAAAKERFGPQAQVLRDIRAVPWALERLERATAGREMINKIKAMSPLMGREMVIDDDRPGYFTVDHPSFRRYQPRFTTDPETGKTIPVRDPEGNIVFDRTPIYVSRQFEGPLRAVLRHEDGAVYRGAMQLKAGAVSLIMNSPLIHNLVEWGRALPLMPGKVVTGKVYFEGNAFRRDADAMREAIQAGLVPIGHRGYWQDITSVAEEPNLRPGRSITAKLLGGIGGAFSPAMGDQIRAAVDKAGDFWHNTLLWDRVADLQAGLYKNMRDHALEKGVPEEAATRLAAHFANRYAGALPNEAMSEMARKVGNIVLFSRTFKLGNLGVMKDIFTGLPRDVQAQISRDLGEAGRAQAVSVARAKAIRTFMVDIALFYGLNATLQAGLGMLWRDKSLDDTEKDYLGVLGRAFERIWEHPLDALNPFETIASFFPPSENEPGKQDRILWTYTKDGTAIYLRTPVGKIGEEFVGWLTKPLQMLRQGEGTIVRPLTNLFANDRGFGRKVYDPDAKGVTGAAQNIGRIVWEFLRSQVPEQQFSALTHLMTGETREGEAVQAVAPFAGFSVSRGAPGGPEMGILYQHNREMQDRIQRAMPGINDLIRNGHVGEATEQMHALGMPQGLISYHIKAALNPDARLTARAMQRFMQSATPEEQATMKRAQQGARP